MVAVAFTPLMADTMVPIWSYNPFSSTSNSVGSPSGSSPSCTNTASFRRASTCPILLLRSARCIKSSPNFIFTPSAIIFFQYITSIHQCLPVARSTYFYPPAPPYICPLNGYGFCGPLLCPIHRRYVKTVHLQARVRYRQPPCLEINTYLEGNP